MVEIEFSVMEGSPGDANRLLPLLAQFEKQHHIHVNLVVSPGAKVGVKLPSLASMVMARTYLPLAQLGSVASHPCKHYVRSH